MTNFFCALRQRRFSFWVADNDLFYWRSFWFRLIHLIHNIVTFSILSIFLLLKKSRWKKTTFLRIICPLVNEGCFVLWKCVVFLLIWFKWLKSLSKNNYKHLYIELTWTRIIIARMGLSRWSDAVFAPVLRGGMCTCPWSCLAASPTRNRALAIRSKMWPSAVN